MDMGNIKEGIGNSPYRSKFIYVDTAEHSKPLTSANRIPRRDWRDYFIMATVMSGLSYGLYFVAKVGHLGTMSIVP